MMVIKEILILSLYIMMAMVLTSFELPLYIWIGTSLILYILVKLIREKM